MSSEIKRLYRSRDERMFAGVCGGIAKYFDVDPTLVRVFFVIFGLAVGSGLLAYIVLAIIMPLEPVDYVAPSPEPEASDDDEAEGETE
jgi:phage shock protein C